VNEKKTATTSVVSCHVNIAVSCQHVNIAARLHYWWRKGYSAV